MKRILVLGAGRVARPCVRYLLDRPDYHVTVADQRRAHAEAVANDHPRAKAIRLDADTDDLREAIREHHIVVNLLPGPYITPISGLCVAERTHMIGAIYVTDEMKPLDEPARSSDTLILAEVGLDPGIDHMMAAKQVARLQKQGAAVEGYSSICGAIPAHEANDNPFGYKFSWSPEGTLDSVWAPARYLQEGELVQIPGDRVMHDTDLAYVPGCGWFEFSPNEDALAYRELYGVEEASHLYRGTYRFPGWCETMAALLELGALDDGEIPTGNRTRRELVASLTGTDGTPESVAHHLGLPGYSAVIKRIEWLGLLDDAPIPPGAGSPLELTAALMLDRLAYAPGERDMIVMTHEYLARYPDGRRERIVSSLVDRGDPEGDSAIARTTGLPIAIACDLVLRDEVQLRGVHIPVHESIYGPSLKILHEMGIRAEEERQPVT